MAGSWSITGQTETTERAGHGGFHKVVVVTYTTNDNPPITGSVSIPASIFADAQKAAAEVKSAIDARVKAHQAVASVTG